MIFCKICKNSEKHYAKGMCKKCYLSLYNKNYNKTPQAKIAKHEYYEKKLKNTDKWRIISRRAVRKMRAKKYFGLSSNEYDKLTIKCVVCGFDNVVELHHKDGNRKNNDISNLIPLCPNHHRMAHMNILKFD